MRARAGNRGRRDAGFTLIEVLVALLVTAIAIVGILGMYISQTQASSYSRHSGEASVLAADGLEKLRTMNPPVSSTLTNVTETGAPGGIFTRTSVVTGTGSPYSLEVNVTWLEGGATRTVKVWGKR